MIKLGCLKDNNPPKMSNHFVSNKFYMFCIFEKKNKKKNNRIGNRCSLFLLQKTTFGGVALGSVWPQSVKQAQVYYYSRQGSCGLCKEISMGLESQPLQNG